jgi:hypothetical protein
MGKKFIPDQETLEEWKSLHARFISCANIGRKWEVSASLVQSYLHPEYRLVKGKWVKEAQGE